MCCEWSVHFQKYLEVEAKSGTADGGWWMDQMRSFSPVSNAKTLIALKKKSDFWFKKITLRGYCGYSFGDQGICEGTLIKTKE